MHENIFTHMPSEFEKINENIACTSYIVRQDIAAISSDINHKMNQMEEKLNQALPP